MLHMSEKQRTIETRIFLLVIGILSGGALSWAGPEKLLFWLLYGDSISFLSFFLIAGSCIGLFLVLFFGEKRPLGETKKQAYRWFSVGVSIAAFVLAAVSFVSYPSILTSSSYDWVAKGSNWVGVGNIHTGSLAYFNYSVLWDTAVGSLFGVLVGWFKLE
jgi:hypothetical protein